jgi:ABC-type multidrug transport system fused ATPase/permease subunit
MHNHFFDTLSIELLFVLSFLLMVLMLEVGFQFGQRKRARAVKAQTAQVRALMGATLGLLAFMLAFTFSAAQQHFESRIQFQIDEAILAKNAFMQTDLYPEPVQSKARQLLLEHVEGRVQLSKLVREKRADEVFRLLDRTDEIHSLLWSLAVASSSETQAFAQSVLGLMDMQTRRVQAALANRIPLVIWLALYFTAVVAMVVVGYQAGLTESRSPIATFSLALAFSAVMMLIMDLDRPLQNLFELDVAVMRELAEFMRAAL